MNNLERTNDKHQGVCLVHGPHTGTACPRAWNECANGAPMPKYVQMFEAAALGIEYADGSGAAHTASMQQKTKPRR